MNPVRFAGPIQLGTQPLPGLNSRLPLERQAELEAAKAIRASNTNIFGRSDFMRGILGSGAIPAKGAHCRKRTVRCWNSLPSDIWRIGKDPPRRPSTTASQQGSFDCLDRL